MNLDSTHQELENEEDELFEHYQIKVDKKQELLRIDKFLMDRLPNVTRNKVQKAIKDGFVKVNQETIKPNYKVHPDPHRIVPVFPILCS